MCNMVYHHYDNPKNALIGDASMIRVPEAYKGVCILLFLTCSIYFAYHQDNHPDHPIDDPGVAHLP